MRFMEIFSTYPILSAVLTALGLGLMIGMVRERQHFETFAGVRTHALTALASVLATYLGMPVLVMLLLSIASLVALAYWRNSRQDHGITGEVALMLTALLGAVAVTQPALASGLGALTAALLYAKSPLHRFSREVLSEEEVHDGLILLASALVILPLLPDKAIDPFGVLNPAKLWRLVVLVMLVGALGHICLRLVGTRWGLPLAGFFAGYVSSTAATLNFAQTARRSPELAGPSLSGALLSNAASISLFIPVLMAMAPLFLKAIALEIGVAICILVLISLFGLRRGSAALPESSLAQKRMFRIQHAFGLVAAIASILLLSAALSQWLGPSWAVAVTLLAAAAELHAALVGIGQLVQSGALSTEQSRWALLGLLVVSSTAKSVIAWVSGGRGFALRFAASMTVMIAAVAVSSVLST
jgi:uncharacterized membrane protein (DUF4010 family)